MLLFILFACTVYTMQLNTFFTCGDRESFIIIVNFRIDTAIFDANKFKSWTNNKSIETCPSNIHFILRWPMSLKRLLVLLLLLLFLQLLDEKKNYLFDENQTHDNTKLCTEIK